MTKSEFRKRCLDLYQSTSGDYLDRDDYTYEPIVNKVDSLFKRGLGIHEAVEELDLFISNM